MVCITVGIYGKDFIKDYKSDINWNDKHNTKISNQTPYSHQTYADHDGHATNFYDKNGNWSLRIDAYTQDNHTNPHIHLKQPYSDPTMIYSIVELIKEFIEKHF